MIRALLRPEFKKHLERQGLAGQYPRASRAANPSTVEGGARTAVSVLKPEQEAREEIDAQLKAAGWIVQDKAHLNLHAEPGVALCETDDLEHGTLKSRGGLPRALALFGKDRLPALLEELNTAPAA